MTKNNRECGECEVCCVFLDVPDLSKPAGVQCRFLNRGGHGCSLHGTSLQIKVCETWQCFWKQGKMKEAHRPDKVGMVAFYSDRSKTHPDGVISVIEIEEDAIAAHEDAKEAILKISDETGVCARLKLVSGEDVFVVPKKAEALYKDLDNLIAFKKRLTAALQTRNDSENK